MSTTPNMSLTAWDKGSDFYTYQQLASNFAVIDQHDHSPGHGVRISAAGLQDNSISTSKIQDDAVNQAKLGPNSVGASEIIDGSVGSIELADNSVTTSKIANGAVTSSKLDPNFLPIGTVIAWYRPTTTVSLPTGWEVCDGRGWSTIVNDWGVNTGNIPDLRNKFILGAATVNTGTGPTTPPDIGASGGLHVRALNHTHTTQPHSHGHSHSVFAHTHIVGPHTHTVSHSHTVAAHAHGISADGAHNHGLSWRYNLTEIVDHQTSTGAARYQTLWSDNQPQDGTGSGSLAGVSAHSHGGSTANASSATSTDAPVTTANDPYDTGSSSPNTSTDNTLANVTINSGDASTGNSGDFRPAYVGLLYLMKVRL